MKEGTEDIIINFTGMGVAHYTRMQFSKFKMNWKQNVALFLSSAVWVLILHQIEMKELYKLSLTMIGTLGMQHIVKGILKGVERSEDKIADKIEHEIDKIEDEIDRINKL